MEHKKDHAHSPHVSLDGDECKNFSRYLYDPSFPDSPPLLHETKWASLQQRGRNEDNISRVDRAPRKSALLNAKSSRHPSGGRSNQPRSQLSLLQRRVKKTSRTITVDERAREGERARTKAILHPNPCALSVLTQWRQRAV